MVLIHSHFERLLSGLRFYLSLLLLALLSVFLLGGLLVVLDSARHDNPFLTTRLLDVL